MMDFNKIDEEYIEQTENVDSLMLFKEIKKLNDKIDDINSKVDGKSDLEKRADILAIKDTRKRQKAIEENIELFADMFCGGRK